MNTPEYLDINPLAAGTISAKRNQAGFSLGDAIAELVDNSIDAQATIIKINFKNKTGPRYRSVSIDDNGVGMSMSTLQAAMRPGDSRDMGYVGKIGRYGIGMKDAFHKWASSVEIITKESEGLKLEADFEEMIIQNKWLVRYPKPINKKQIGTKITMNLVQPYAAQAVTQLARKLRKMYGHGFGNDLSIFVNGERLQSMAVPFLREKTLTGKWNGKYYELFMGMIDKNNLGGYNHPGEISGVTCVYNKRKIFSKGAHDSIRAFYMHVRITLFDDEEKWILSAHKNAAPEVSLVLDLHRHDLADFSKQIKNKEKSILVTSIEKSSEKLLTTIITNMGQGKRPNRGKSEGTKTPSHNGTEHKKYHVIDINGPRKHYGTNKVPLPKARVAVILHPGNEFGVDFIDPHISTDKNTVLIHVNKDHNIIKEALCFADDTGSESMFHSQLIMAFGAWLQTVEGEQVAQKFMGKNYSKRRWDEWRKFVSYSLVFEGSPNPQTVPAPDK